MRARERREKRSTGTEGWQKGGGGRGGEDKKNGDWEA